MKPKKLKLDQLKIKSFVTELDEKQEKEVVGGTSVFIPCTILLTDPCTNYDSCNTHCVVSECICGITENETCICTGIC
jgi:hypothetical protein